jgi:cytidine deaminase
VETIAYDRLEAEDRELLDAAREAMGTSYAPYSGVQVGAALRTPGGIVTGSNIENGAYGSTLCAERTAVGRANARGERSYAAVAITARGDRLPPDRPVAPCGACRQVLHEMARASGTATRVLMASPGSDRVTVADLAELLPLPFDPPGS